MNASAAISRQARELCSESDEHHDRVWFCMTCKALELRLASVSEFVKGITDLSVTVRRWPSD
ncbi:Uncharacterised protein [Mycobacteroides abscessus subsp. bolletii]|nr:Uncharacterised protein [Mycobacteroides abscessus subsp. bolletii]SKP58348.1 Uncharacterised protein [Mycobacteroides abscessus subsp. bolletii]SKP80664.1 Uncharacterised protein [Mycobacteroides abscessus subsp. bolletii]SKQ36454.1 Uncharacterised protein [Mycobacteroides abscessus subsp. bolletii]